MAQLAITASAPSDGDTDVFVNNPLNITFDAAVLASSVSGNSVVLIASAANTVVSTNVELVTTTVIRISPNGVLDEDTLYIIRFPGTDSALSEDYVLKDVAASEALTTTLTVTFRTGARVFIDDTAIDKDATDLSLEGDLNLPIHVKALGEFAISGTVPKNHSYDIALTTNPVIVNFNKTLSGDLLQQDWLDVDLFPIMDNDDWLASGDSLGGATIPQFGLTTTAGSIHINFSGGLPQNMGASVTVSQHVQADDGSEFGPNEYVYSFTTERYPKRGGIHAIKREIPAAVEELHNDYIASVLLSKAVEADITFGGGGHELALFKWVVNSAIVEILDDAELNKALAAGTRRQLGDFSTAVDPIIGKLAVKHARAEAEIAKAWRTLLGRSVIARQYDDSLQGDVIRTPRLWFGVNGRLRQVRFVTHQLSSPGSNTNINREAKVPPDIWWS